MSAGARGFTLIEVLVALAIVALGMAAVMSALSSSADTVSYLRERTFAQWVGLNQIATLRLSGNAPTGTSTGEAEFAGRKWHWSQDVVATDVKGMVRIEVSVRPAEVTGDDKSGWVATVDGSWGDAINRTPDPTTPNYNQGPAAGGLQQGIPGTAPVGTPLIPATPPADLPSIAPSQGDTSLSNPPLDQQPTPGQIGGT